MNNKYEIRGDVAVIFLEKRGKPFMETMIDADDINLVVYDGVKWYAYYQKGMDKYYVRGSKNADGKVKTLQLHRVITGAKEGYSVDHVDGNPLNNRRSTNLRVVTQGENLQNRKMPKHNKSGHVGVNWVKSHKRWRAQLKLKGEFMLQKDFISLDEAVKEYNAVRDKYHKFYNPNRN